MVDHNIFKIFIVSLSYDNRKKLCKLDVRRRPKSIGGPSHGHRLRAQKSVKTGHMCSCSLLLLLLLLHPFNGLFSRTTWISRYQKGKTSLDLNDATGDEVLGCIGISRTICKQSAPRSRQITTPTRHHWISTDRMRFFTPNQQSQSTKGKYV